MDFYFYIGFCTCLFKTICINLIIEYLLENQFSMFWELGEVQTPETQYAWGGMVIIEDVKLGRTG